jgi:Transport protein particle (TRAPP) component
MTNVSVEEGPMYESSGYLCASLTVMLIENDPAITKFISVSRDMSSLSCSALAAGLAEAVLDGLGFVGTVSFPLFRIACLPLLLFPGVPFPEPFPLFVLIFILFTMLTTAITPARSRDGTQRPDRPIPELYHHSHKARPECFGEGGRSQVVARIPESMYCMGNRESTTYISP